MSGIDRLLKTCTNCRKVDDTKRYLSTGGAQLCHRCAHELGLLHSHPEDPNIEGSTHYLDGFFSKEEIEAHLKDYEEKEAQENPQYVCYNGGFTEIGDPDHVRTKKHESEWYCNGHDPIDEKGKRNCRNCTHMTTADKE